MIISLPVFLQRLVSSSLVLFITLTAARAQVVPHPADSFVESIGVNVHWAYTDRVYYTQFPALKERLAELGIRHLRDGTTVSNNREVVKRINGLYDDLSIRTTFITGRREKGYASPLAVAQISEELKALKEDFPTGLIAAIEGPNEYDAGSNHQGETETSWVEKVTAYQKALYEQVKADPDLRDIPVIGPSFISEQAYKKVGNLDAYIDYSCLHAYQSWRHPGTKGWGSNGYGSLSWQFKYMAAHQSPSGKPIQSTECGYNTYLPAERGVTEQVEGKYITRMFAEFFRRGIARAFSYELIDQGTLADQDAEKVFGLLRNDQSPKPAFFAIKGLINLLADPGQSFGPTALAYSLEGDTENVRQLLLQKRDGTYYLLLWLEVESWNGDKDTALSPDAQKVTVQLPNYIGQAQLHRQDLDGKMKNKAVAIEDKTVSLDIHDRMQVLVLQDTTLVDAPDDTTVVTGNELEIEANRQLLIYPNPSPKGVVQLQLTGFTGPTHVRILDLKGQIVYEADHRQTHIELPTHFPQGLYLVKASDRRGILTKKLLME